MMSKKRMKQMQGEMEDKGMKDDVTMNDKIEAKGGIISIFKEAAELDDSEDCLYMNIYVPSGGTKNKAILIYIHGGMFVSGKFQFRF